MFHERKQEQRERDERRAGDRGEERRYDNEVYDDEVLRTGKVLKLKMVLILEMREMHRSTF